ncbi:hypothetical protein [Paractinoplanes durhamensis]|uniref:hypothetical protein n=1 Tax=Paractinoplanes durhamensis TaxID=113563 RepID=UPI00363FE440
MVRKEHYRKGELKQVRYYAGGLESIIAEHARDYPGVEFAAVRTESAPEGFRWTFLARFAADGSSLGFITHLVDPAGSELMTLEYDAAGDLRVITKDWDESPDESGMLFEYGSDGQNVLVSDLEYGDSLNFEGVLQAMPDPAFYADGLALPAALAGTPIPAVRDHFPR